MVITPIAGTQLNPTDTRALVIGVCCARSLKSPCNNMFRSIALQLD